MSLALVRKELREHGWVLAAVLLFDTLSLVGLLLDASERGGRFAALTRFCATLGTVSAVVAAERLFAREYGGKTQLFLEVLPVTRARVMGTKWTLGAVWLLGLTVAAWYVTLRAMRATEVVSGEDAGRALLSCSAFALALWSFSAMAGLLGRFRLVPWIAAALFLLSLQTIGSVPLGELPLFRLLGETAAMARTPVPPRALWEAGAVVVGGMAVTGVLGLAGSGSLAAGLAGRMTSRERVFVIASVLVVFFATSQLTQQRELPPFELEEAVRSTTTPNVVGVMTTEDLDAGSALALSETIARDVDSLGRALGIQKQPPVFFLPQRGLDPTETQRAQLASTQGIVVRAAPDVEPSVLRALVLHEVLSDATKTRGLKDDRHVLLDGLAIWWVVAGDATQEARWWRRAAASPVPLTAPAVTRWSETSERVGTCVGNALAFTLVDTLVRSVGRDKALALAARLFSARQVGLSALLESLGTDWPALTAEAEARRASFREAPRKARAEVALRQTADGNVVAVHVTGVDRWRVLYGRLGPWSTSQLNLPRLDARGSDATLPVTLARGERVLVVVERDDEALGCPMRLEARRMEVP